MDSRLLALHAFALRDRCDADKADQEKNKEFVATMYAQPPAM